MSSSTSSSDATARAAIRQLVLVAGAAVLLLGGATEWLLRTHVVPEDYFWHQLSLLLTRDAPAASFGDSHVVRGHQGSPEFVNLAFLSEGITEIDDKVRIALDRAPLQRVALQADPHLFAAYRLVAEARDYRTLAAGRPTWWPLILDPYYRPRLHRYWFAWALRGGTLTAEDPWLDHGGMLHDGTIPDPPTDGFLARVNGRVADQEPLDSPAAHAARARYVRLVEDLVAAGVSLCLVEWPLPPPTRDAAARRPAYAAARDWFRTIALTHGARHVSLWDLTDDPAHFFDPDHLSAAGASVATQAMTARCFGDD